MWKSIRKYKDFHNWALCSPTFRVQEDEKCLSLYRLFKQNTPYWVAYKQHTFVHHSSGSCKSQIRVTRWSGESPLPGHRLLLIASHGVSFTKSLIPFMRTSSLKISHQTRCSDSNMWILGGTHSDYSKKLSKRQDVSSNMVGGESKVLSHSQMKLNNCLCQINQVR